MCGLVFILVYLKFICFSSFSFVPSSFPLLFLYFFFSFSVSFRFPFVFLSCSFPFPSFLFLLFFFFFSFSFPCLFFSLFPSFLSTCLEDPDIHCETKKQNKSTSRRAFPFICLLFFAFSTVDNRCQPLAPQLFFGHGRLIKRTLAVTGHRKNARSAGKTATMPKLRGRAEVTSQQASAGHSSRQVHEPMRQHTLN